MFPFSKVSDGQESAPPTPAPTSGIVGALMEVMQKRSKAIHSSGESHSVRFSSVNAIQHKILLKNPTGFII